MRCNLTEAEQKAALEVPFRCTGEEQEFIERCFIGYLFFEHEADENGRLGVTTECTRCGRKVWWTEREWKRFKQENDVKARSNLLCPDCGCGVTLYPRGRLRNGNNAGKTQMEIASEIGISQAQVSRLEKGALGRLRAVLL